MPGPYGARCRGQACLARRVAHFAQSHRSLHVWLDKQGWICFGCGVGGDVLQPVEFIRHGIVTRGQSGSMPGSHGQARDFLAARVGLPPLSKMGRTPEEVAQAEDAHQLTLRVREALTAIAEAYHRRLAGNREVMAWFRAKCGIGEDTIASLKIGYGDNDEPSIVRLLLDEPGAFTMRELAAIRLTRRLFGSGIPFDLLVLTPEEVEERLRRNGPFIQEILSTGQVVYQRT